MSKQTDKAAAQRFKERAVNKWITPLLKKKEPVSRKDRAKEYVDRLIAEATEAELLFRDALTDKSIIFEFQKDIHSNNKFYIVDFYIECKRKKLAVELDGKHHYTPVGAKKDLKRTQWLQQKGITVIRYSNSDVFKRLPMIVAEILDFKPHMYKLNTY